VTEGPIELALVDDADTHAVGQPDAASASAAAFRFVERLAVDLSGGELELPFLPDIAIRIRALMNDPDCSMQKLGKALSTEPGLAARLIRTANSAVHSRAGNQISEITAAVSRLGFEVVRNASWTYALAQMQRQAELEPVSDQLAQLWKNSTDIAALAFVVARETNTGQPDEALMAGMTHNVGTVYILSRSVTWDDADVPGDVLAGVVAEWSGSIGRAIAEHWELSGSIIEAIASYDDLDRIGVGNADLCDVLSVATRLHGGNDPAIAEMHAAQRLDLTFEICNRLVDEAEEERTALLGALGI